MTKLNTIDCVKNYLTGNFDNEALRVNLCQWVSETCNVTIKDYVGINQADYTDVLCYKGTPLEVDTSGCGEIVMAALVAACALNGVSLTIKCHNVVFRVL